MHIISRKKLREFCQNYADSCDALKNWYKAANKATWNNLAQVQAVYPQAEAVGNFTVFNIKDNKYRLIVDLVYSDQIIYLKYILTHAESDKDKWKNDPYF
ncbi:type II toxin-antitoxin system HigB family toxin [Nostoc sp. CHAB 5715]|uniref:type II toxin-antitoxin system HigB family toxin n=1 Tax=Nostoc sp. CHAB 5715 TaxID=2780400 RepID=UPI001E64B148|nr:type II toxin-antitoxin system HigB family toxin [Nostoc sp. CHAB 5715]MCC5625118.1 type II toxin-antitoxin system HigB family toxin [Nostoc sp. CHAB 5715]